MGAANVAPLDSRDNELIDKTIAVNNHIYADGGPLSACHFKQAIMMAMTIAQETNRYLDEKSPWKIIKENREAAATSLYVAICAISYLKTMLYPFLPFSSQKVHEFLGFEGNIEDYARKYPLQPLPTPGQRLRKPQPLFAKLDDKLIEEETARLGQVRG
jgi:methionyl-tRNA synthetase